MSLPSAIFHHSLVSANTPRAGMDPSKQLVSLPSIFGARISLWIIEVDHHLKII